MSYFRIAYIKQRHYGAAACFLGALSIFYSGYVLGTLSRIQQNTILKTNPLREATQFTNLESSLESSLESRAYPLANPKIGFSLLDDRGVVAGTCADEGWDYVFSYASDLRTKKWDEAAMKSHRSPGIAAPLCGYGYHNYFEGAYDNNTNPLMLDIGANMGLSMMPYYARGWKVIAFEPIPDNINTLRRNLFINGIPEDRIALVHGAVTNATGVLQIYAPRGRTDNTAISQKGSTLNVKGKVDVFNVSAIVIDKYIDNAVSENLRNSIMLIKIDTQGHELNVLQGMKKFLSSPPSKEALGGWSFVVVAEYHEKLQRAAGHEPNEMLDFMRNMGYEVRCSMEDELPILSPEVPHCPDVIFSIGKPVKPIKR